MFFSILPPLTFTFTFPRKKSFRSPHSPPPKRSAYALTLTTTKNMSTPLYLKTSRSSPSQRSHFSLFIPSASHPPLGTIIHAVGAPMVGYSLEFKRNYDPTVELHSIKMFDQQGFTRDRVPDLARTKVDFLESSFFHCHGLDGQLPEPCEVRARATDPLNPSPKPVIFKDLNLLVKFGCNVIPNEAQCLYIIKKIFGDAVPCPEVYGWRIDGQDKFIYMQLIEGQTLKERWETLNDEEKTFVCIQLREILTRLRSARQDPSDQSIGMSKRLGQNLHLTIIGSINGGSPTDIVFECKPMVGSFPTVEAFNDWFAQLPQHWLRAAQRYDDPYRESLPDAGAITLTHGDIHGSNIMVTATDPPRILGLLDWAHGGWYPDYWEYCKAAYVSHYSSEWRSRWISMFLEERLEAHEAFAEFCQQMGV